MGALRPGGTEDIIAAVQDAARQGAPLEVRGGGSKSLIGRPDRGTTVLEMSDFASVVDYDPPELVLTVGAGAPLARIEALLADHDQMLAFEPYDHGHLFDDARNAATIGGIVGAAVAGSRRLSAGGVRDHLLGFHAVSGRGEAFVAGAKVIKNVTGFDLSKLIAGSWGRLAVLTQLTLKVVPRPRASATVALSGLDDPSAAAAMSLAMGSQGEVAAAAHLPSEVNGGRSLTLFRIEGFAPSVMARRELLSKLLRDKGQVEILDAETADASWRDIRHVAPLRDGNALWRLNLPPSTGWKVANRFGSEGGRWFYDWAGGLVWMSTPSAVSASAVRQAASEGGGHAMLVRADQEMRLATPAQHPEPAGAAALAQRIKAAFDPADILDPQRFR